jgi:hypothetical protein
MAAQLGCHAFFVIPLSTRQIQIIGNYPPFLALEVGQKLSGRVVIPTTPPLTPSANKQSKHGEYRPSNRFLTRQWAFAR